VAVLAGEHRTEEERARDAHRHPEETLAFFGLEPDMRIVEIWPGRGWYTAVLAPLVRDRGQLIAATMDPADRTFRGRFAREFRQKMAADPTLYGQVETSVLFPGNFEFAAEGSADMVLTFRSIHNWIRWGGYEQEAFHAMARALRTGGILGVVQHRAPEGADPGEWAERGYVPEAYVVELAQNAGLILVGQSEVNANPRDEKTYPNGVWSLPPTYRGGDEDRERFTDIGESDRMTLKFQKPPAAGGGP